MFIEISDPSQTGEARRRAVICAEDLKMDTTRRGEVALVATEIATNLIKHAGHGYILIQQFHQNGNSGLRLLGVDKGPGIADMGRALSDGHSTAGTMGTGLGAIKRLSDSFDAYSIPGSGTVVSVEFNNKNGHPPSEGPLQVGVVSEAIAGEDVSGDGWGIKVSNDKDTVFLMVVDGLGHGVLASEAAREGERILAETKEISPKNILGEAHLALKKTRGAAMGIAKIEMGKRLLLFSGVGNVSASIVAPGSSRSLAWHNGTLGQQIARLQEFTVPWNDNSILVMHSDGLGSRWDLERYPGIWSKHPSIIAAVLHRDFSRDRDDVTVLVAKAA
jgi:anti-sigma regulatory factor (Ser/Thr protein kinase)